MRHLLLSGGARLIGLLPQAIATLLASRLILDRYGLHAFDTYALVIALMALIPLNNLGMGASVTQAIAAHGVEDERGVRATLTASRALSLSALGLVVASVLVGAAGLWPRLLGDAAGSNWLTVGALVVFALTFVPGLGASVLLGANRNHLGVVVGSFLAPVSLLIVALMLLTDLPGGLVMVVPPLALLIINLATMAVSARLVAFPWLRVLREMPSRRRFPGARIRSLTGPMLISSICIPLAFCTDRIVLSHVSTQAAVANYSVVLQLCGPIIALIVAAAQPLWPMITRARVEGHAGPQMAVVFVAFGGAAVVCGLGLVLLADPVGHLIGGDRINLGHLLPASAALVMVVLAIAYPLSMTMVDPKGARFVAACAVITLPANVAVSIVFSRWWGAPGPLLANLLVSTTVQVIPILIYGYLRERSGRPIHVVDHDHDAEVAVVAPGVVAGRHRA